MKKIVKPLCLIILGLLATVSCQNNSTAKVYTNSAMKKVMKGQDLSAHILWDTLQKENLFALAPLGRIEGEVTIVDGQIYTSTVDSANNVIIKTDWSVKSPFAVYSYVEEWTDFSVEEIITSIEDLEKTVEAIAKKNGYNLSNATPYRVRGEFDTVIYHVISKPKSELEHNHKLHIKAKKKFYLQHTEGELLGFYSKNHEGIFTHKGHFTHTHFLNYPASAMGHLDHIHAAKSFIISLPKQY